MQASCELGDITAADVDAIVNAANSTLLGGGGVDGAIHRAAGPELLAACRALRQTTLEGGLPVGEAVATPGFALPARWVIHTVGPNRHAGETDPRLLASCFKRSLDVAQLLGLGSIAFPAVSAGVYGWQASDVAEIAIDAVTEWAEQHPKSSVQQVRFILFNRAVLEAFARLAAEMVGRLHLIDGGRDDHHPMRRQRPGEVARLLSRCRVEHRAVNAGAGEQRHQVVQVAPGAGHVGEAQVTRQCRGAVADGVHR